MHDYQTKSEVKLLQRLFKPTIQINFTKFKDALCKNIELNHKFDDLHQEIKDNRLNSARSQRDLIHSLT